jgi:tetratricopeptide (TPR) repeat protein
MAVLGIIIGLAFTAQVAWYVYRRQKSEAAEQAKAQEERAKEQSRKLDALQTQVGRMAEYLDGLPKSTGPVRTSFDAGRAAMKAYKWDDAIAHFKDAIKSASGTQLVALYNLIGLCHYTPGRWDEALQAYEESRRLAQDFGEKQGEAAALGNIGVVWQLKGEWDKALEYQEKALQLDRELGNRQGEAQELGNIGLVWQDKGEWDRALEYHYKALKLDRELGDKQGEASDLGNIGNTYVTMMLRGRDHPHPGPLPSREREEELAELAVPRLAQALTMLLQMGAGRGPGQCLRGLGECLKAMGNVKFIAACEKAGMKREEAEELAEALGQREAEGQ